MKYSTNHYWNDWVAFLRGKNLSKHFISVFCYPNVSNLALRQIGSTVHFMSLVTFCNLNKNAVNFNDDEQNLPKNNFNSRTLINYGNKVV